MDAKITKQRLGGMLSYDWFKIVAVAAAVILGWSLVLTMTATRITPAQQFTVFNHYANNGLASDYEKMKRNGVFSYEILECNENDLTIAGDQYSTILQTRTATAEGDIMFIPNLPDPKTEFTNGQNEKEYKYSYLQTFVAGYGYVLYDFDPTSENGYFAQMDTFLDGYYGGDHTSTGAVLDTAKIEEDFRARTVKDKRFKTDEQKAQGVQDEIARIQKYKIAYDTFMNEYLNTYVTFTDVKYVDEGTNTTVFEGKYAINVCPEGVASMKNIKKHASYWTKENNQETKDMNVMFFKYKEVTDGFQYETLLYLNAVIADCLATN